jgi:hypothetical protein
MQIYFTEEDLPQEQKSSSDEEDEEVLRSSKLKVLNLLKNVL